MTSEKQTKANRSNAKKSTGPKSQEGKARSSKNATTHGILSTEVVVHGELMDDFEQFRAGLFVDLAPTGTLEVLLVEKIANYAWRLRRAIQAEAGFMERGMSSEFSRKSLDSFFSGMDGSKMANISRYESMLSKHFYKAIHQLRELQRQRKEELEKADPLASLANGFVW
ncbi:MAG: hypothetical protein KDK78_09090 [Chlamydiia bacterium]|nr:hypothetical protein [Chlamydiia bacterium]